jgi:hypothetical protein
LDPRRLNILLLDKSIRLVQRWKLFSSRIDESSVI